MPRHFLVKRHKNCIGTFSYRDRLHEGKDGTDNCSYTTTIVDTDKHNILREGDYITDYTGYGSPDSGYSASPNSSHLGFARDKENLATDSENNNNNKNCNTTASVISYYDMTTTANMSTIDSCNYGGNSDNIPYEEETDTPMDLSMPSRKKVVLSSVPAYLQRDESHHQHHIECQQQQQQQQPYQCKPSPNDSITALLSAAAVMRLDSFNKLYLNNNNERSLCATIPPLSPTKILYNPSSYRHHSRPDARVSSLFPGAVKTDVLLDTESVAHTDILSRAQCISVPSVIASQRPSSLLPSSSSPPPASAALETIKHRATPLTTSSPLQSPSRKRSISSDNDEICSEYHPQDLSKSLPAMKKSDINESNMTPSNKTTSSQKARTTAPAIKKSPGSVPSGKRLKAVRRLNFDIDTTSPVSGTIIKDAADFHPEEGKVVYGDIEPSFNFVEVTPEARAELEKIENKIGDYICQLCKEFYEDAFQLAQHRCSRIIHVEYRCPECEKVFNCPANLASHRRWHKPRVHAQNKSTISAPSKIIPTSQRIAPKPDCNGNMTDAVLGMALKRGSSPDMFNTAADNSQTTEAYDVITSDIKSEESIPFNSTSGVSVPCKGNCSPVFSNGEDLSKPSNLSSNTGSKENSASTNVTVSQPLTPSSGGEEMARSVATTSFAYTSTTDKDSFIRPDTVIAINPLKTTPVTYGSSLTLEERSLVLQVINSHNRQQQTTAITSTTNSYHTSDTQSSTVNFIPKTCVEELEVSGNESLTYSTVCQGTGDNFQFLSAPLSTSPPPLNLIQGKGLYKYQEHQNEQRQAALSEHQVNPQIGCSVCGKKFQRQAYLRKHILSQHGKQYGSTKSEVGADNDKMVTDNSNIYGNQATTDRSGHLSNITDSSCSVCGKCFTSESARFKHESTTHGLNTVLGCNTCNMTFTSKAALDKHSRYAHATETFSCKYCSSTFHSSPGLTRHINKCHPTENRRVILLQLPSARTY